MKIFKIIKEFVAPVQKLTDVETESQGDLSSTQEATSGIGTSREAQGCPYCASRNFVKRGTRKNKHQVVQLYLCRNSECGKTFTAQDVKGKHFPLNIVIESMSYYNLGFTLEETCRIVKKKFGVAPEAATLSDWIDEYKMLCRYERLRPYAIKMFAPRDVVEVVTMAHRQLYRFRYHRAKTILMLEEFRNRNLLPLKEYLDGVSSETPHQYFQDGARMSEVKSKFDKAGMIVRGKYNYANKLAGFVLQSVSENKQRHEELQRFLIANDSVTVATEVPVYIRREDIEHFENELGFVISEYQETKLDGPSAEIGKGVKGIRIKGSDKLIPMPRMLSGHIDFVQIRNGSIHLLDYKPNAAKEKPIEQLTWYALALSRLTGLRLYNFVCGWFDENEYFQFYPLHVVKKLQRPRAGVAKGVKPRRRYVHFKDGTKVAVPEENVVIVSHSKV